MWVPSGHYSLDVITKLLIPQKFVYTKHLKQMNNQIVLHQFEKKLYIIWKKLFVELNFFVVVLDLILH